ncbi:helix-loop-helix DNA-binding domain-containing protein [Sarocladium implicatum]|nr:helix-loop-helix DNA-binding domain-containing protein [Sarocladium implicatum]
MSSGHWSGQDHHMGAGPDDDFQQFLDMSAMGNMGDGMQFDFNTFPHGNNQQHMMDQSREHPQDSIMGNSDTRNLVPRTDSMMPEQTPAMATTMAGHSHVSADLVPTSAPDNSISDIDAQIQYLQQQKFHQQQRQLHEQRVAFFNTPQGHSIPPTPQSFEMPPGSGNYYSAADLPQSGSFDRPYQRSKEQQDMAFTPLVSPAVTPLDPHFNIDGGFTVPGAYFSPLTSPALRAQGDNSLMYDHSTHSNNSPVEHSPVAIDSAMSIEPHVPANQGTGLDLSKKARKNNAAKARAKQSIKSSPISKPMRKKTGPSPALVSQVVSEVEEGRLLQSSMLPLPASSTEGSEDASVSPEALTDMPPPPVPARRSNSKSPYIQAQNGGYPTTMSTPTPTQPAIAGPVASLAEEQQPHPATPASLMKLPASRSKRTSASNTPTSGTPATEHNDLSAIENMEDLELPESISNQSAAQKAQKKQPKRIDTAAASRTPNMGPVSAKTPSQAMPSPSQRPTGIMSTTQSPQLRPGSSGPTARKTPQLSSRESRKGSVQHSPALLPRISPNIKPLLPGTPGMSAEDSASRLLMSKSNYQNILEGNTVPGVSYPSELSTNLTSKRTSHKIAEQGRRNRINSALQVMASLIPEKEGLGSTEEDEKKESKQANAANSKASVVENAIVHMRSLKQENMDLKEEVQTLKKELERFQSAAT